MYPHLAEIGLVRCIVCIKPKVYHEMLKNLYALDKIYSFRKPQQ